MGRDRGRLAHRCEQVLAEVVDLDRGEPEPLEPRGCADLANEAWKVEAGGAVPVAAEVDAGEDDFPVPLLDSSADLAAEPPPPRGFAKRPRTCGMTQKAQEKLQPSWTFTNARTRSRPTSARTQPIAPTSRATNSGVRSPGSRTTLMLSGSPANASPARFAPQPVT